MSAVSLAKHAVFRLLGLLLVCDVSGSAQEPRNWTDKTGQFSIDATFVSQDKGSVRIRDLEGRTIRVPKNKLSQADLRYVASLNESAKSGGPEESRDAATLERTLSTKLQGPPVPGQGDETLQDFLQRLNVTYFLDERSLRNLGLTPAIGVETSVTAANLSEQLDAVLGEKALAWYRLRTVLVICTAEDAGRKFPETVVYPVAFRGNQFEGLARRVTQVEPSSWESVGGPGRLFPLNPGMVIRQSAVVHRQLVNVLPVRPLPHQYEHPLDDVVISLQISEGGWRELTSQLQSQLDRVVRGSPRVERSSEAETKFTVDLSEVTAADTLDLVLGTVGCTWLEMPYGLELVSETDAEMKMETRDVTIPFANPRDPHFTIQLVSTICAPKSWEGLGGPGRIQHKGGRTFTIVQSQPVFRELNQLLSDLRGSRR